MQKNLTLEELKIMKIKVLPILVMFSLMLAGINVIALGDNAEENNNIQQDLVKDHLSFSKAILKQKGEYLELTVEEANTVLRDAGKPMIPSITKTYTFPRGTKHNSAISINIRIPARTRSLRRPMISATAPEGTSSKTMAAAQAAFNRAN